MVRKNKIQIAICSLNQIWEDKERNKVRIEKIVKIAKNNNTNLVIFPEMTLTGYSLNNDKIGEDIKNSETLQFFIDICKSNEIAIIFGMASIQDSKYFNSAFFVQSNGFNIYYNKIHTFSYVNENNFYNSGDKLISFNFYGFSFGLSICYDLRFPDIFSLMSINSEIIINIANWPASRIEHWFTLLKARAIENQIFMIGVNRIGEDPLGNKYIKSSKIIGPDGTELIPFYESEELDIYEVDKEFLKNIRGRFPTNKDKRYFLYKKLYNEHIK